MPDGDIDITEQIAVRQAEIELQILNAIGQNVELGLSLAAKELADALATLRSTLYVTA